MSVSGLTGMARKIYLFSRIAAYGCGAAGALLVYVAKRRGDSLEPDPLLLGLGWGLLLGMFLLFTASYGFHIYFKFFRRAPRAGEGGDR